MKTAYLVITIIRGEARLLSIFSSLDLGRCSPDEIHVRPVHHEHFDSSAEELSDAIAECKRKCAEHAWVYPGTFGKALKQLSEPHVSGVPWPVPEESNELTPSIERNLRRISTPLVIVGGRVELALYLLPQQRLVGLRPHHARALPTGR